MMSLKFFRNQKALILFHYFKKNRNSIHNQINFQVDIKFEHSSKNSTSGAISHDWDACWFTFFAFQTYKCLFEQTLIKVIFYAKYNLHSNSSTDCGFRWFFTWLIRINLSLSKPSCLSELRSNIIHRTRATISHCFYSKENIF